MVKTVLADKQSMNVSHQIVCLAQCSFRTDNIWLSYFTRKTFKDSYEEVAFQVQLIKKFSSGFLNFISYVFKSVIKCINVIKGSF